MRSNISQMLLLGPSQEANQDVQQVQAVIEVVHYFHEELNSGPFVFQDAIKMNQGVEDQLVVF